MMLDFVEDSFIVPTLNNFSIDSSINPEFLLAEELFLNSAYEGV